MHCFVLQLKTNNLKQCVVHTEGEEEGKQRTNKQTNTPLTTNELDPASFYVVTLQQTIITRDGVEDEVSTLSVQGAKAFAMLIRRGSFRSTPCQLDGMRLASIVTERKSRWTVRLTRLKSTRTSTEFLLECEALTLAQIGSIWCRTSTSRHDTRQVSEACPLTTDARFRIIATAR